MAEAGNGSSFMERRKKSIASVTAAAAVVLAACSPTRTEGRPVSGYLSERPSATSTLPTSTTTTPTETTTTSTEVTTSTTTTTTEVLSPSAVNERSSEKRMICLGAFVDKLSKTITVLPVSEKPINAKVPYPMIITLTENGQSRFREAQIYEPKDYAWVDLNGNDLRSGAPACKILPVRVAHITPTKPRGIDLAIVSPGIEEWQEVDVSSPAKVEESGTYNELFHYSSDQDLRGLIGNIQHG